VRVTFKQVSKSEAHQTIAKLPILLAHRFGPRAWGWFDKEAAQENLANVYFDAAINQIVEQETSVEANVYAVRGESDDQENLSEMMQTMAFENLDDESVINEDAMDVVEFDLEFQVDPSRRFEASPATGL
jgi:Icc-related predicted phosphoesterase